MPVNLFPPDFLPHPPAAGTLTVLAVLGVALLTTPGGASYARGPSDRLQTIERALGEARERQSDLKRKASTAATERDRVQRLSVSVAARMQRHEAAMSSLEEQMELLAVTEVEKSRFLGQRKAQLTLMLAALQRIAYQPPAALIALPTSPNDTVRSAILLRAAIPAPETQARELNADVEALVEVRQQIIDARKKLKSEAGELRRKRIKLAALTKGKIRLARKTRDESLAATNTARRLGAEARDLRELLARLQEERQKVVARKPQRTAPPLLVPVPKPQKAVTAKTPEPPTPSPFRPTRPTETTVAALPLVESVPPYRLHSSSGLPVQGRITRNFGQGGRNDEISRGLTIRTRPKAQVVSPGTGEVVFAGKFHGFGRLLIIEHRSRYHVLLAGMARIDVAVGDQVLAREPVGVMNATAGDRPALYLELRRSGRPINPLPWLVALTTKANG